MSWTQDYQIPGLLDLYEKVTGETLDFSELVKEQFRKKGYVLDEVKKVVLDENEFANDAIGEECVIKKLDARGFEIEKTVYIPKVVKKITSGGNYGLDVYAWKEKNEGNFKVEQVNYDNV